MPLQILITLTSQQHSSGASFMAGCHIVDGIANLNFVSQIPHDGSEKQGESEGLTMIRLSPPSSSSHALAICKIPCGSGFGGLNSRVTMGAKVRPGRCVWSRCVTGPLHTHQPIGAPITPLPRSPPAFPNHDLLEIPRTQSHPNIP
jgi:hypothetical protein